MLLACRFPFVLSLSKDEKETACSWFDWPALSPDHIGAEGFTTNELEMRWPCPTVPGVIKNRGTLYNVILKESRFHRDD